MFAWLEDLAYGTVAEIAYAWSLHKEVFIAGPAAVDNSDLWFVTHLGVRSTAFAHPEDAVAAMFMDITPPDDACESPIEKQLFAQFLEYAKEFGEDQWDGTRLNMFNSSPGIFLYPQYEIDGGRYRLDFALLDDGNMKIAIEADGHEFHERTKDQAERDKRRDRYLQSDGWKVLRFTGSEIHRDAAKCVAEVMRIAGAE